MAWGLIICLVIGIIVAIIVAYEECDFELGPTLTLSGLFSILAFLIWVLVGMCSLIVAEPVSQTIAEDQAIEIYSLADGNLAEGYAGSFLGRGYIDEELKYTFVKKDELGYTIEQVDADDCYVKYTEDTPKAVPIIYHYGGWIKFWCGTSKNTSSSYVFYLPEGTIVEQYNIDLK